MYVCVYIYIYIVTRDYYCPTDFALCLDTKETADGCCVVLSFTINSCCSARTWSAMAGVKPLTIERYGSCETLEYRA